MEHAITDIRYDEEYARFYMEYTNQGRKLPPPLEGRTLYQEFLQQHANRLGAAGHAHSQLLGNAGLPPNPLGRPPGAQPAAWWTGGQLHGNGRGLRGATAKGRRAFGATSPSPSCGTCVGWVRRPRGD